MADLDTFDPKRAAAGEPIQFHARDGWVDVKYVGETGRPGGYVIYMPDGTLLISQCLRMKPLPTKKWVLEFDELLDAAAALSRLSSNWPEYKGLKVKEIEVPPAE